MVSGLGGQYVYSKLGIFWYCLGTQTKNSFDRPFPNVSGERSLTSSLYMQLCHHLRLRETVWSRYSIKVRRVVRVLLNIGTTKKVLVQLLYLL